MNLFRKSMLLCIVLMVLFTNSAMAQRRNRSTSPQPPSPVQTPQLLPEKFKNGVRKDKNLIRQLNEKAVDTLVIGSNSFVLEAYLWYNSMPGNRRNANGMMSSNTLVCTDSVKIPDNIKMVKQFVIYKDSIWVSDYTNEEVPPTTPSETGDRIERMSRGGPKWGTDITVDVISQMIDSKTNNVYYIRLKDVQVESVY